jgi:tetratricopeptide (TPR) repeat protein
VGEIDRTLNQISQMETYNRRALEISQEAEYMRGITVATVNLGDVALRKGDTEEALRLYSEVIELSEGAGLKTILTLTLFLAGDANYILQKYDQAVKHYKAANKRAVEIAHLLYAFNADISELVTLWADGKKPTKKLLKNVRSIMGSSADWSESTESGLMKEVRRKVLDDPESDSDLCVFFDGEKCFECRVERKGIRKECFGNLLWMGGLCLHFKEFLSKLEE